MAGSGEALVLLVLLCCLCQGAADIECSGRVWIDPAPVVPVGSDISIGCLSTLGCPAGAELLILLNYSRTEGAPVALNGSAARLRLRDFRMPFGTVACFSRCAGTRRDRLVCGAEVRAGYPPDPPGNLSCAVAEGSERLECGWDAGRRTQLPTQYRLHLRRLVAEDEEEEEEEEKVFPADSPVLLSELRDGSRYSVWVQASNALGTARSAPRHLSLQELVVPALPAAVGAETTETSPPSTTVCWRSRTQLDNVLCQERHKATGAPAWHVESRPSLARDGPCWQHALQSDAQHAFQVRCRLSSPRSPWSAWSPPFLYTTPEAAPAAAPGVWRRLGPALPNGSHEVTVLIQPLPARDARGRILGYSVSAAGPAGAAMLCRTSGTECRVLVPPGTRTLLVTAHNSKGASSPASIALNRGAAREEFPAPGAVEVKPEKQSRVLVRWEPPQHSERALLWFVLEWVSSSQHGQEGQYFWKKVPHQDTHTYIPEAAAGAPISVSVYAVYPDGISEPSSSRAPPEELLLGSTYGEMSRDDDIRLFLALILSVVGLSVLFAVVMFKKSVRKRIKATIVSLLPKWLFEEFPRMENSTAVKSLQDKQDFPRDGFHEPFLDSGDPTLTEIEEVPAQEEQQSPDTGKQPREEVPKDGEHPRTVVPPRTPIPEQPSDYKPQLSDGNALGYVAAGIYQAQPPAATPEPEPGIFSGDYTSHVPQLWEQGAGGPHLCLLEKINLVLNTSQAFPVQGHGSFPQSRWERRPPSDVPEQMLVPEELLSSLRSMNREAADTKPFFPQSMGTLF